MQTVEQQLLKYAYDKVKAHEAKSDELKKKYGIWCHNLPGLIAQCGLAQAAAFLQSKEKEDGIKALLADLGAIPGVGQPLLDAAKNTDDSAYLFATDRVQRALVYFKRFAKSILGVDEQTEEGNT